MDYTVEFKPRAVRDLRGLSSENRERILKAVERLQKDLAGDIKKLTATTPEYRLRVGTYRVLFEVEENEIHIYRVVHRREAYR